MTAMLAAGRRLTPTLDYVVFDLDDTLVNTAAASFDAWTRSTRALGIRPPTRTSFDEAYGKLSFRSCFETWLGPHPPVGFDEFATRYWDTVVYSPIGNVTALLSGLRERGIGTGIVTNSVQQEARLKIASAAIPPHLLAFVVGRRDAASDQAPPKDLIRILYSHRVDPRSAVYISDNPADFVTSTRANLPFRGVLTGIFSPHDFATWNVPTTNVYDDVHAAVRSALANGPTAGTAG
jgi:phosphoglycolate phosphatase-like HAD superfamily hydrolase